jgi:RNA polymerase sigma-70 factor, ECF subfamily
MYSEIRNEDYLNIKPMSDAEESAVTDTELAPNTSRDPDSDEALLIATGNSQDTEAFNRLFQRYSSKIYAMGMKLTRNEQLSKDLVQEAMLNVWRKARLYDLDRGSAQGWIFTITRNRCFDMLRKIKRQPNCVTADDIWPPEDGAETGFLNEGFLHEEKGSLAAEASIIAGYCEQLPKLQQAVIEQIYVLDRTHEEAAAILEIPLGTLKSRLRLGVSKLRQLIGVDQ